MTIVKPSNSITLRKIGCYRWRILLFIYFLIVVVFIRYVGYPLCGNLLKAAKSMHKDIAFIKGADTIATEESTTAKQIQNLQSTLNSIVNRESFNEATVLDKIYRLADSTGCTTAKVEIGSAIAIEHGHEIPVLFTGNGSYTSIGTLVEGIENLNYTTRIRQITMKKTGATASLFLDFVVLND